MNTAHQTAVRIKLRYQNIAMRAYPKATPEYFNRGSIFGSLVVSIQVEPPIKAFGMTELRGESNQQ